MRVTFSNGIDFICGAFSGRLFVDHWPWVGWRKVVEAVWVVEKFGVHIAQFWNPTFDEYAFWVLVHALFDWGIDAD